MNAPQPINRSHYRNQAIQPIQLILDWFMGFCEGCIIKYVSRWREKDGVADLYKALDYISYLQSAPGYPAWLTVVRKAVSLASGQRLHCETYLAKNHITGLEAGVIRAIVIWNLRGERHQLAVAKETLLELINQAESEGLIPTVYPNVTAVQALRALKLIISETANDEKTVSDSDWRNAVNIVIDNESAGLEAQPSAGEGK